MLNELRIQQNNVLIPTWTLCKRSPSSLTLTWGSLWKFNLHVCVTHIVWTPAVSEPLCSRPPELSQSWHVEKPGIKNQNGLWKINCGKQQKKTDRDAENYFKGEVWISLGQVRIHLGSFILQRWLISAIRRERKWFTWLIWLGAWG